jgi:epsilon-lactone hydrolase
MAERMRAAGCQVELEIWPRMPHTWQVWARVLPEARAAIERIGAFVQSKWTMEGVDRNGRPPDVQAVHFGTRASILSRYKSLR